MTNPDVEANLDKLIEIEGRVQEFASLQTALNQYGPQALGLSEAEIEAAHLEAHRVFETRHGIRFEDMKKPLAEQNTFENITNLTLVAGFIAAIVGFIALPWQAPNTLKALPLTGCLVSGVALGYSKKRTYDKVLNQTLIAKALDK